MRKMKSSGIKWLGQYPATWNLTKIKYCLQERTENNNPVRTSSILSLTAKQGVVPYEQKEGGGNKPKEDLSKYRLAYPGDIVINSMNAIFGSVGLSTYYGCVSPVYYMLRPINKTDDVRFYNYIFQTSAFQKSIYGLGNGILEIRMRISMDKFGQLFIPIAPPTEQKVISDYLDNICAEIDTITTNIEQQIKTLEQYKRSIVTETVTKGLISNVEMKDSGIDWIGKIPVSWHTKRIKYMASLKGRIGWQGLTSEEYQDEGPYLITGINFKDGSIDWENCVHVPVERWEEARDIQIENGDLLITKDGTVGKVALVSNMPGKTSLNSGVLRIVPTNGYSRRFLYRVIQSDEFWNWFYYKNAGNSTIIHLYQGDFAEFIYAFPSYDEQEAIADYLDQKCADIDNIITNKKTQIENLSNYKKSLMYEYVTGKKEVPVQ